MKLTIVEKKTYLAGLQCTLTSSCAKTKHFSDKQYQLICITKKSQKKSFKMEWAIVQCEQKELDDTNE